MREPNQTRRLLRELAPYRRQLVLGLICLLIAGPAAIVPTLMWMVVVDYVLLGDRIHWLVPSLLIATAFYAVSAFFGAWRDRYFEFAGQAFIRDLRERLFSKLLRQTPGYINEQRSGDLQSRVISDVDAVESSLISGFSTMAQECYTFILVLGAIIWIAPLVGATVFVPLAICFFVVRHFNERMKAYYRAARNALGEVGARLQETVGGFAVIKGFNRQAYEQAHFTAATDDHYKKALKAVRLRTVIFPSIYSIAFSTNVIMLGLGALLVYKGHFTLGGLVVLRGFWWQLNSPVRTLAQVNDLIQRALAASARIYQVLDAPVAIEDKPDARTLQHARLPIQFDRVAFAYGAGGKVLDELNFLVKPGETIGLAGDSGAGKTTLLGLLARFQDPTGGTIRVGEEALTAVAEGSWRTHLAVVPQDTFLFNTSVFENIRFGRPDATDAAVYEAADLANASGFISRLPEGFKTVVGERGVKLSGGQRQRIGVARAFLANPDILLMDEPTSAVEPESEQIIQESIFALMKGRTVFLSSHRPSLLRQTDRVFYLEQGRIVESGPHDMLMTRNGPYAGMIRHWTELD